jgi:hypothetical protein
MDDCQPLPLFEQISDAYGTPELIKWFCDVQIVVNKG